MSVLNRQKAYNCHTPVQSSANYDTNMIILLSVHEAQKGLGTDSNALLDVTLYQGNQMHMPSQKYVLQLLHVSGLESGAKADGMRH